jgi:hypothetical protein
MRTFRLLSIFIVCILIFSACQKRLDPFLEPTQPDENSLSFSPTPTIYPSLTARLSPTSYPIKTPTLPISIQQPPRTLYQLEVALDFLSHKIKVAESIHYWNYTTVPIQEIPLVIPPNRYPGRFRLLSLSWMDGSRIEDYNLEDKDLFISLLSPLSPGENINFHIDYEIKLPKQASPLGYTQRQVNLGDWYPFIPPYASRSRLVNKRTRGVGEYLVYDTADYIIDLTIQNEPPGLAVAASAPGTRDEKGYHFRLKAARSFALSLSRDMIQLKAETNGVSITAQVFPEHQAAGEASLLEIQKAVALFSERFGPYNHTSLSLVEAVFFDGMEYDGLFFLDRNTFLSTTHPVY